MKKAVTAAALFLVPLVPDFAAAQSLRLVDNAVFEWRGDNQNALLDDDDYGVGINKLYLNGEYGDTSAAVQVDTFLFTEYPDVRGLAPNTPSTYSDSARLERISLTHQFSPTTSATLGDGHLQLGRGIALALRKVDELGTDQALRGATFRYDGDDTAAMAFAGITNIANMDGVTKKFLEDPNDLLAGASGTVFLGNAALSIHGLYLQPKTPTSSQYDDDQIMLGGGYVDVPIASWLALYAEGAVQEARFAGEATPGHAGYLAADIDLQVVSLLAEGLYLDDFRVAGSRDAVLQQPNVYNQPPTLERIDQEVLDNENVRGGRLKVSRGFFEGDLLVHVNGAWRQYGSSEAPVDALHGYAGFELHYDGGQSRWDLSGGWRQESNDFRPEPIKTMAHVETDWVQAVGGGWAMHLVVNHEERTLEQNPYRRGTTMVGFDRYGLGSLMAEIGYDTQNQNTRQLYLAGILAWEASDSVIIRSVIGSQRGGLKCIGGVCRDFPAFAGARLEATVQYDLL